ncbi:RagB/SusD family nutrient uptake outer membrane protein [Parapedobacter koreensis]|uniref:Starch-binding associating with outer membrane n=1 Tax=Parapedobacter koreensis TaxID=332977 RepID=A0A1H7Q6X1_9SPHI|nr:RagB/SusD family nutrient uptake outer membrane protein [Parapedobacter koreensis]SEL43569.1 Starch-binding associating with outer membrane [Parapedobacter koreensis]
MNKITKGFIALISMVMVSCNQDFLETTPFTEFSETAVWSDPALVETFINQIYFRLDDPLSDGRMKSNIVDESHYRGNAASLDFNNSVITQDNLPAWGSATRYRSWEDLYKSIRYCNIFFQKFEEVPFGTEVVDGKTLKDRMAGEAHFLRAYLYFFLVSTYGGVPLVTDVYELDDDFSVARGTFAECVDFIVSECDQAAELLPVQHSGNNIGRATKGAALALKSRILLYAASDLYHTPSIFSGYANPELVSYTDGDQTERWRAAKNAAKAVIDLNEYSLFRAEPGPGDSVAQNMVDLFISKQTEEDIFIKFFTTPMAQNFGLYTSPNGYHGWGTNAPIGEMVDAFEMADGTKFDWNNPVHAAEPYQDREPRFYATIFYNEAPWRERPDDAKGLDPLNKVQTGSWERWDNATNSVVIVPGVDTRQSSIEDWNGSYTGYYCRKYIDPAIDAQYIKQTVTWRFIRYAEILLNYAEACIELGEDAEARTYINRIRKRAGLQDITESGDALRARYRNERRVELAFEDHRFFDVRRWAIGPEAYKPAHIAKVVYKLNPDKTTATRPTVSHELFENRSWNDKAYFLPITRDELNKNNLLIQNPGY